MTLKITDSMVKAAMKAMPKECFFLIYDNDMRVILEAALQSETPAPPPPETHLVGTTPLIQALSRMAGNRQSDGTSSLVSAADRTAIIEGCHDLMLAARQVSAPQALLMARVLAYLEGSDPTATSGGEKNSELREAVRAALEAFK